MGSNTKNEAVNQSTKLIQKFKQSWRAITKWGHNREKSNIAIVILENYHF